MNIETALKNLNELLVGESSIPVDLNNRSIGIDESKVSKLMDTLDFLIEYYSDKDEIPKSLAFAFVDISKAFERCLPLYSEVEQDRIFDLKEDIVSKGYEIFE